ncbi:ABC transporter permease [Candidatus Aquiluna sp. UB-MaderosW2red]|uniref:ABC transporter permease n=1 Tax=Candidatus Aquiluna sp. UB-MaderosW2red TaxID=1855377 RepID=UPI000875EAFF|nr:ABC transporter permease [Candidatus Aquiluna sp. UB-MaderosW2red]SCX04033.1 peptide/nickel transport system permease protein [Candidatus Aquiluna sp. UB-MaderosW2red]
MSKKTGSSSLLKYLAVRFTLIFPTILILVTMVFVVMRAIGDPITAALGGKLTSEELAIRITAAGYDRPILVQYFEYIGQILRGDFGSTLTTNQPITALLGTYGMATLELAIYAIFVAIVVGVPLGMIAAKRRDTATDAGLRFFAILAYATPVFFVGLLLKLVFAVAWPILPVNGRSSINTELAFTLMDNPTGLYLVDAIRLGEPEYIADVLRHAVLPGLALGLLTAGIFLRLVRTNMIGTLNTEYVDAARSRGVSETRLTTTHALRPALIPIITVIGMQIAVLLSGAVLTETTFEWKGLGFQLAQYLNARDYVAVQGIVALLAIIVALTNFLVDVIVALVDPRVKF